MKMDYLANAVKWVQNGYVISYYRNKPFFLLGAIPGEWVEFQILKENKNHGFGVVKNIIEKNPIRIKSDCQIFGECGGCFYRHIEYSEEIKIKLNLLCELSEIKDLILRGRYDLYVSPYVSYRNQVKVHFFKNQIGFYKMFSNTLIHLPDEGCRNLSIEFNKAIQNLYLNNKFKSITKEEKFYFIKNQLYYGEQTFIFDIPKNKTWQLSAKCFLQTNRFLIYEWLDWISRKIQNFTQKKKIKILELFSGTMLISSSFLEKIEYIEGYELNTDSIQYAKINLEKYKIKHQLIKKDLYKDKIFFKDHFDFIIINPPRKGFGNLLLQNLKDKNSPILYSSCNPITFNRDVIFLKKYGYKIFDFAIFDFFPRTYHLEIVALLAK